MRQHRNLRASPLSTGWFRLQIDHHTCSFSNTSIGLNKLSIIKEGLKLISWVFKCTTILICRISKCFCCHWRCGSCIKLIFFVLCENVSHSWILLMFSPFLYVCVTWGSESASPVGPARLHYWWRWLSLCLPLSLSLNEAERKNQQRATSSEEEKNIKVKAGWKKRLEEGWKGQKDVKKDERRLKEGKVAGIKWDKKTKDQEEKDKWNKKQQKGTKRQEHTYRANKGQKRGEKRCERRK